MGQRTTTDDLGMSADAGDHRGGETRRADPETVTRA